MSPPTDPNGAQMKRWLPPIWYNDASSVDAVFEAEGEGLSQFQTDTSEVNAARMPQTAPDWGLSRFEEELGLSVAPQGMSLDDRRGRILARFRGIGATIYRLKQIAASFGYGDIAILPGIEDWTLYVQFIDQIGIPANLDAHKAEIRNNVEAHLDLSWAFHFTLWQEVLNTGVLWCQLYTANITWDELKTIPFGNLPTTIACGNEPAGTMTIEIVDQTLLGNLHIQYFTPTIPAAGSVTLGTGADSVVFALD